MAVEVTGGNRIDPETGEDLRAGVLTRAELRDWLAERDRHWRRELGDPDRKPAGEDWAWTWSAGWVRPGKKGV